MQSQTRSGKVYAAIACPRSFSVATAVKLAVEQDELHYSDTALCCSCEDHDSQIDDVPARRTRLQTRQLCQGSGPDSNRDDIEETLPSSHHPPPSNSSHLHTDSGHPNSLNVSGEPSRHGKRKAAEEASDSPPARRTRSQEASDANAAASSTPEGDLTASVECVAKGKQDHSGGWRENRKQRRKAYKRDKRREERREAFGKNTKQPRPEVVIEKVSSAPTVAADIDIQQLPSNVGGYEARRDGAAEEDPELLDLGRLKAEGYSEKAWDGKSPFFITHPVTGEIIGVGVGAPLDGTYEEATREVHKLFLRLRDAEEWDDRYLDHKRGRDWVAINMGNACGFGNEPYNQRNGSHEHVVEELRTNPHLRRLAVHQSEMLKFYIPRLYDHYHARTIPFRETLPHLVVNWEDSIFCSAACNLGPQVATFLHRDCMNLSFGFCAVHALGNYDHTKGGHLVLKELKLVIQFPPGALILLPSAVITHGNVHVQAGETRTSFTQYTAGAVFRYVDNGFRTEEKFKKRDKKEYEKMLLDKPKKWENGLKLWSTVDELLQRAGNRKVSSGKAPA